MSICCLLLAWLSANGAAWNVVQVVAWAQMYRDYSRVMPATQALKLTLSGEAPCDLCQLAEEGRESTRGASTAVLGATDKLVLAFQTPAPVVLTAPDFAWPGLVHEAGHTRTDTVPVPPPRV